MHKKAFSLIELSIVILIIGILIAGVTQASRLVKQMRLNSARTQTQSSPVAGIRGVVAWWEATSANSFSDAEAEDTKTISTWFDLNPTTTSKINLTQATSNIRPTYAESAINNLPAVKFNGTSQYFEIAYNPELQSQQFTVFVVTNLSSYTSYGAVFSMRNDSTPAGYMVYAAPDTVLPGINGLQMWVANGTSFGAASPVTVPITFDKTALLSATNDGATSKLYNAGTLTGSEARVLNPTSVSTFRVGAGRNETTPDYYLKGYLGELIIFNRALKTEERQAVENYLGKKWGVKVS